MPALLRLARLSSSECKGPQGDCEDLLKILRVPCMGTETLGSQAESCTV